MSVCASIFKINKIIINIGSSPSPTPLSLLSFLTFDGVPVHQHWINDDDDHYVDVHLHFTGGGLCVTLTFDHLCHLCHEFMSWDVSILLSHFFLSSLLLTIRYIRCRPNLSFFWWFDHQIFWVWINIWRLVAVCMCRLIWRAMLALSLSLPTQPVSSFRHLVCWP